MSDCKISKSSAIHFFVNGKAYKVSNVDPMMKFNTWLRSQPGLTGTKIMCEEGGCGCCVVAMESKLGHVMAVNSCLLLLGSVDGCKITTTEGLGSRRDGFHQVQSRLAEFGGSQCGYCTPGFVMNMYSLLQEKPSPTQQQIEDSFDGNLCRCTGYRPILDAMKSFASDADPKLLKNCGDIEDLVKPPLRNGCLNGIAAQFQCLQIEGDTTFTRPIKFDELVQILKTNPTAELVCGNTATGVYKRKNNPETIVDISKVGELRQIEESDDCFTFDASVTLSELIQALSVESATSSCNSLANHIKKVASVPVRNMGSWAGNLMIKHQHREFPSDVFVLLEAAQALIEVYDVSGDKKVCCSASELMVMDMKNKIIVQMTLPKDSKNVFKSYKIMSRAQNVHAYVNAAFKAKVLEGNFTDLVLVFGGISKDFVHARKTEEFLKGKNINSTATFEEALSILSAEIQPVQFDAVDATVEYKHDLAMGLFYKFYLSLCDKSQLGPGIESAIPTLTRPVSSGTQTFDSDPEIFPVSKPIPKLASKYQASGEAVYISDKIPSPEELYCTFVLSDIANADIECIDFTEASKMNGFVQIITGKDFPSDVNNTYLYPNDITQPLLAVDHVEFAGQPLAIVVAETNSQAKAIAQAVKVTYKNEKTPLLTVKDAIQANSFFSIDNPVTETGNVEEALNKTKNMVSGELHLGYQYHFYMETQIARAEPTEEGGFKLDIATQMQKDVQDAIAFAFNTSSNKIELTTKRIGGAYGGKATNSIIVGCAAALASHCTRRPVCFHGDLKTCMTAFGTRTPFSIYYTVGYDDDGILEAIDCKLYTNSGPTDFDGEINDTSLLPCFGDSAYFCSNRRFKNFMCKTNIPSTTWCRSPGSLQLTGFADQIVEHVAKQLGKDPISVKRANLYKDGQVSFDGRTIKDCNLTRIHDKLMEGSNIQQRQMEIDEFNKNNIWKKRGLAVTPMRYRLDNSWGRFAVLISMCAGDGTVIVSHGGIESGQGIHTKVAQVLSYELGVPVNDIMVQRTTSVTSPNSTATGGSITSEVTCKTVLECCKILKSRIEPVRAKMDESARWRDVIERCYREDVDLQASYLWIPPANETLYNSYGCTASEIELDVLTGEFVINQVDIIFDCGISLNPSVDIGQVEGAFVMGLGFWLTEEYILDKNTGRLLNDGTWDYNVPTSKDIPVRWNIELLKNSPNPVGILRSKASGEPPMCMSISVLNALKRAVEASRRDRGMDEFFQMPMPATVEKIHTVLKVQPLKDFKLL